MELGLKTVLQINDRLGNCNHYRTEKTRKKIKSSEANLRQMIIQAPVAIAILEAKIALLKLLTRRH
jgi:hypothetical protein